MGAEALLLVSSVEDPSAVMDALDSSGVTYFPMEPGNLGETVLEVDGTRYYGRAEILQALGSLGNQLRNR